MPPPSQPQSVSGAARRLPPEILAPAGGRAQFFAALNSGADAVYLGLKEFNARARAGNFTEDELRELVPLARRYGMKVLVTVNILIKETELPRLVDKLSFLEEIGVHAIIVQDPAVARIARTYFPALRLHASTQMAIHNLAGVRYAQRLGFRRVVLAREMTAQEIRRIREAVPVEELELEAFCHGSLCYSYSGLCFFSGAADARSGNRGECAYTCRQPYKILNEPGHGFLFSMRDLDTSRDLGVLLDAGVNTLKIEGRKKDAQYVATVVKLYRQSLDRHYGGSTLRPEAPAIASEKVAANQLTQDLSLTFQRGATTFFLKGRYFENVIDLDNPTHVGLKVGVITEVTDGTVRVLTETALERFDGLRVVPQARVYHARPQHGDEVASSTEAMRQRYENQQVEFSLRDMRVGGRWVPTATAGQWVDIAWTDCSAPQVGDLIYKIRSADLKRRTLRSENAPPDARLRPLTPVDVAVQVTPENGELRLHAEIGKAGTRVAEAEIRVPQQAAKAEGRLTADLREAFALFGDDGLQAEQLRISGDCQPWFVPRAQIKELKRQLGQAAAGRLRDFIDEKRRRATDAVIDLPAPVELGKKQSFAVKVDRLESLDAVLAYARQNPDFPLDEILFEPKRAFLPNSGPALRPEDLAERLVASAKASGIALRLALPTVVRQWDEAQLRLWFTAGASAGINRYEIGNIGGLQLLKDWNLWNDTTDVAGDFTLYALNAQAALFWAEQGLRRLALCVEDDRDNIECTLARWPHRTGLRPQAILFKDTPLFIAEACSLTALHNGCPTGKVCGYRTLEIEGPTGERFFVGHESCKSIVYGREAYSITQNRAWLAAAGIRDFRLDFLTRPYTAEQIAAVLDAAAKGERIAGTHSANFERSLL